ncbi:hypothetical protein GCM10023346_48230 [Arthrobacter gyeryongensis]|uniref:Uncharacterized protein n=1 Tax=Arthrobacter gyeryongensis TaxID=1650592 RepID=A0ABP9SWQ2_9MICC
MARGIHSNPEVAFEEVRSSEAVAALLAKGGFSQLSMALVAVVQLLQPQWGAVI